MVENTPAGMLTKQKQPLDPRGGHMVCPCPSLRPSAVMFLVGIDQKIINRNIIHGQSVDLVAAIRQWFLIGETPQHSTQA